MEYRGGVGARIPEGQTKRRGLGRMRIDCVDRVGDGVRTCRMYSRQQDCLRSDWSVPFCFPVPCNNHRNRM